MFTQFLYRYLLYVAGVGGTDPAYSLLPRRVGGNNVAGQTCCLPRSWWRNAALPERLLLRRIVGSAPRTALQDMRRISRTRRVEITGSNATLWNHRQYVFQIVRVEPAPA